MKSSAYLMLLVIGFIVGLLTMISISSCQVREERIRQQVNQFEEKHSGNWTVEETPDFKLYIMNRENHTFYVAVSKGATVQGQVSLHVK